MAKDVVESVMVDGSTKNNTFDFIDFAFSKEVVRDHPQILALYNRMLPELYKFAQYQAVWPTIQMVEDSKLLAEMQLDYYSKIHKSKGRIKK